MARGPVCTFCEEKLVTGEAFCAGCGHPTQWAGHDERVLWELGQWEVSQSGRAGRSDEKIAATSARTQKLADSVRTRAARPKPSVPETDEASLPRRSFASRFRRVAPPDAAPAASAPAAAAPPAPAAAAAPPVAPAAPASRAPASRARPASGPAAPPRRAAAPVARPATVGRVRTAASAPLPTKEVKKPAASAGRTAAPSRPASKASTATAPAIVPEAPLAKPAEVETRPAAEIERSAPDTPVVMIRKPVDPVARASEARRAAATAPPQPKAPLAPPVKTGVVRTPGKPAPAPKAKPVPAPLQKKNKERRKEVAKRERKHRRHSKRVSRRAASLDLKDGERVSLSIEGWSRFRRATLVVTNYRVALITRVPPQARWIPLEEVSAVTRRWQGAWSIVVAAPTEVITLQKAKGQMLASFKALLDSEVAEARTAGSQRHHGDITQEWAERATTIWDSRARRFRLWLRRHPIVSVAVFVACAVATYYLTSVLTSVFSPVR